MKRALLVALLVTAPVAATESDASCAGEHEGARLKRRGLGEAGKAVRIGLVADAKEPLTATLGNLERFAGVFHREKVVAVLLLGGLGSTEEEIARVITALKAAQAPLFALPGDREPEAAFHAGVLRARKAGLDVTDLSQARAVAGDGLGLFSLPGERSAHYLAPGGCGYGAADVGRLAELDGWLAADAERPVLLIAHSAPRGSGPLALDWAVAGANDGDPELAKLLPALKARVGAFAGGADSRLTDGQAPVAEGTWSERLYVNVGAADAVPHELAGGGMGRGQAMLLELHDGKARAKVVR